MSATMGKVLEACTVCGGLIVFLLQVWKLPSSTEEKQYFVGMTALDAVLTLLLDWRFKMKTTNIYRTKDSGLWCCWLIPALLKITNAQYWELFHCLVPVTLIVFLKQTKMSPVTSIASAGLVVYILTQFVFLLQELYQVMLVFFTVYYVLVWYAPRWFPRSFTFGEVTVVTQLLTYFMYTSLSNLLFQNLVETANALDQLAGIVFAGILVAVLSISQSSKLDYPAADVIFTLLAVGLCFCLPLALYLVGWATIQTVLAEVFLSQTSILLLIWWMVCTVVSILIVTRYGYQPGKPDSNESNKTAGSQYDQVSTLSSGDCDREQYFGSHKQDNTVENSKRLLNKDTNNPKVLQAGDFNEVTEKQAKSQSESKGQTPDKAGSQRLVPLFVRKYFHLVMLCVYIPGFLYQPDLLYLASIGAAALLIIIEAVRVSDIPPFSASLDQYLVVFLDQQDQGHLILTPIYLLIGCSLPLWMAQRKTGAGSLCLYAGLISVGVGDSVASVIGRRYGQHKWPGSPKSVEGTMAAVICQILVVLLLAMWGIGDGVVSVPVIVTMCLSACLEAFSTQIDNLIVPVFTFMLLAAV